MFFINNIIWIGIGFIFGVYDFYYDKKTKNKLFTSIFLGIFGAYLGGMAYHFVINPTDIYSVDIGAIIMSLIFAFIFIVFVDKYT